MGHLGMVWSQCFSKEMPRIISAFEDEENPEIDELMRGTWAILRAKFYDVLALTWIPCDTYPNQRTFPHFENRGC